MSEQLPIHEEQEDLEPKLAEDELAFQYHVERVRHSGDATLQLNMPLTSIIVGEQTATGLAHLIGDTTSVGLGIATASFGIAGGALYANRDKTRQRIHNALQPKTQKLTNAQYELLRVKNPAYKKGTSDKDIPRYNIEMHYYGTYARGDHTTTEDMFYIMTLAEENNVDHVCVPAKLAEDLGIPTDDFTQTTTHQRLRGAHVPLSKKTPVANMPLLAETPKEWLRAISKVEKNARSIETMLSVLAGVSPNDAMLTSLWQEYRDKGTSEEQRMMLHAKLHHHIRAGMERQLHDKEIDGGRLRQALRDGTYTSRSQFTMHLQGEVHGPKVTWRDQNGKEANTVPLHNALQQSLHDDETLTNAVRDPHADPTTTKQVVTMALFSALDQYLHPQRTWSQTHASVESNTGNNYGNGALYDLAEHVGRTGESRRGRALIVKLGGALLGITVAVGPLAAIALIPERTVYDTSDYSGESLIGDVSDTSAKNHKQWDLEPHNMDIAGYWSMDTSHRIETDVIGGQGVLSWQMQYPGVAQEYVPTTKVPAVDTSYVKVDHDVMNADIVTNTNHSDWGMRVPIYVGTDVVAASMDGKPVDVQHMDDGTTWLHSGEKAPSGNKKPHLTYWLAKTADAPRPHAIDAVSVIDMTKQKELPVFDDVAFMNTRLPATIQGSQDGAKQLASYIHTTWKYELQPIGVISPNNVLESFIAKALEAKRANCNVASTLTAIYDMREQRNVAEGYHTNAGQTGLYSHDSHMWTVDRAGNILDPTPYKGADKFNSYFAEPKPTFWNADMIGRAVVGSGIVLTGLLTGGYVLRPRFRKWRYDSAQHAANSAHLALDEKQVRVAQTLIEQALYAPRFSVVDARLQAERSQKTAQNFMDTPNRSLISEATEAMLQKRRDDFTDQADIAYINGAIATIAQAREAINKQAALTEKANRLREKLI